MKFEITISLTDDCRECLVEYFTDEGDSPEELACKSTDIMLSEYIIGVVNSNSDHDTIGAKIIATKTILEE